MKLVIFILLVVLSFSSKAKAGDSIRVVIVRADTSVALSLRYPGRYFCFRTKGNRPCIPYDWFTKQINSLPGVTITTMPLDSFSRPLMPYTN